MTVLQIFGGPLKREIVQLAYEECGQSDYTYTLQPEDYDQALRRLNALMYEWRGVGIDLGYNFPTYANGSPEEESGIPFEAEQIVALFLAVRIAPTIGKTLSQESKAALAPSLAVLRARYMSAPTMPLSRSTPRGSGNRWNAPFRDPYYNPGRVRDATVQTVVETETIEVPVYIQDQWAETQW